MKLNLSPRLLVGLGILIVGLILQWVTVSYLTGISKGQFDTETRKLKTQIALDIATQLSRAMASEDDLAALTILKESRTIHPQLQQCEVFEKEGKVILHTNPNMMNKTTKPYKGPRPVSPEVSSASQDGRFFTLVLVPVAHDDDLYFRAYFDEISLIQNSRSFAVRFYILIIVSSVLLALFALLRLQRFDLVDPHQKADLALATAKPQQAAIRHTAALLLSEMRHAVLAISRDNKITAANSLALELLNCRDEELSGMHVMQSPLPKPIVELYQEALKQPGQVREARIALTGKSPALPVKIVFTPAGPDWEMAVVSLS